MNASRIDQHLARAYSAIVDGNYVLGYHLLSVAQNIATHAETISLPKFTLICKARSACNEKLLGF